MSLAAATDSSLSNPFTSEIRDRRRPTRDRSRPLDDRSRLGGGVPSTPAPPQTGKGTTTGPAKYEEPIGKNWRQHVSDFQSYCLVIGLVALCALSNVLSVRNLRRASRLPARLKSAYSCLPKSMAPLACTKQFLHHSESRNRRARSPARNYYSKYLRGEKAYFGDVRYLPAHVLEEDSKRADRRWLGGEARDVGCACGDIDGDD